MSDSLRPAFIAAEAVPWVKAGGLADVAGALPRALASRGHRPLLFLPLYDAVDAPAEALERVLEARVPFFGGRDVASFRLLRLAGGENPSVYFVDAPGYFSRPGLYTDPETGLAYEDDGERFLFFSLAVLESLDRLDEGVDIVHCNDYHTGLVPALLERFWRHRPALEDCATVYSIHNLAYQGLYAPGILELAGIPRTEFRAGSPFEFWGRVNFMKAGIHHADLVSTVSPRYAREITEPELGCGLEGVLRQRGGDLVGILNGIDAEVWSPDRDPLIEMGYDARDPDSGKEVNKIALLARAGLEYRPGLPLVGVVSRLVSQKGFDLLPPVMERLMSLPLQMVVLGTGEKELEAAFAGFAERWPDRLAVWLTFDDALAHQIEAGADFFLMPSRYEPCGLNQMYSLRYGTIPVVRYTGGLADTVSEVSGNGEEGSGFGFTEYEPEALLRALGRALSFYGRRDAFSALRRRVMALDHSWDASAAAYEKLYRVARLRRLGHPEKARPLLEELRLAAARGA